MPIPAVSRMFSKTRPPHLGKHPSAAQRGVSSALHSCDSCAMRWRPMQGSFGSISRRIPVFSQTFGWATPMMLLPSIKTDTVDLLHATVPASASGGPNLGRVTASLGCKCLQPCRRDYGPQCLEANWAHHAILFQGVQMFLGIAVKGSCFLCGALN